MANLPSWDAPGVKTDTNFINSANSTNLFRSKVNGSHIKSYENHIFDIIITSGQFTPKRLDVLHDWMIVRYLRSY